MNQCILKILTVFVLLIVSIDSVAGQQPNATQQLYNGINTNWQSQSYAAILTSINARLQANPNDVLALMLKANYYVFAQKDITQAQQAANSFLSIVNAGTTNQTLISQAQAIANRVLNIPTSDTTPFTQDQITSLHTELQNFPFIEESFVFWGKFTGQL
jgi:hypothetical protein